MLVLDTNVIFEVMRGPQAAPQVRNWVLDLRERPVTTVVNRAEIMAGLAVLPEGRRRDVLTSAALAAMGRLGATLPLTPEAADRYGAVVAARRAMGRPIGAMDALVAAIVLEAGGTLATRNDRDFDGLGIELIDPWQDV